MAAAAIASNSSMNSMLGALVPPGPHFSTRKATRRRAHTANARSLPGNPLFGAVLRFLFKISGWGRFRVCDFGVGSLSRPRFRGRGDSLRTCASECRADPPLRCAMLGSEQLCASPISAPAIAHPKRAWNKGGGVRIGHRTPHVGR